LSIEKYFKNGTYVMVLEDCLWFKRGQIIKKHLTYSESEWRSNKSPNEVLSDYFSLTTTIECNLNLDLDLPKPTSCQKQKFGCSRGCLNYCFSDSDNRAKMELYNIMKKYKDML
jgi:hypothetical protein